MKINFIQLFKKLPLIIGIIALVIGVIYFLGRPREEDFTPENSWVL